LTTDYLFALSTSQHWDYYPEDMQLPGGNRYATVIMYLNDVEEGGETVSSVPVPSGRLGTLDWHMQSLYTYYLAF
jgi:hypothetical protein